MPDGDVIKRGVRHVWRASYESLSAGGADADVRGAVSKALTGSLRKWGIPAYADAAELVHSAWNQRLSQRDALAQVASAVGSIGGTRNAALLEIAVKRTIIGGPTGARADQAVLEAYLNAEVEAELMAKIRPAMLESGKHDPSAVEQTVSRWTEETQEPIRRIAQQLIDDPTGRSLRAPPSNRRTRKNTAQMLDEAV